MIVVTKAFEDMVMSMGGDLEAETLRLVAKTIEDGGRIISVHAPVNGYFSCHIDDYQGLGGNTYTLNEKWKPDANMNFPRELFQHYGPKTIAAVEERTLKTLVACILKPNNPADSVEQDNPQTFFVIFRNCQSFRLDNQWHPTWCPIKAEWVWSPALIKKYTVLETVKQKPSILAQAIEKARGTLDPTAIQNIPRRNCVPSKPVTEEAILEALGGFNLTLTEIHRKFSNHASADDIRRVLDTLVGRGFVKFWKEPTGGRPAEVYTVNEGHWQGVRQPLDGDGFPFWDQTTGNKDAVPVFVERESILPRPQDGKYLDNLKRINERPPATVEQLAQAVGRSVDWVKGHIKPKHGYHTSDIPKGKAGEFSKIEEEFFEAKDAFETKNPVMLLLELSDMVGAIERFLDRHYPGIDLDDIVTQAKLTNEVFKRGYRENRDPK